MILAYTYPLLSVFWSILMFFVFVIWVMTLFHVLGDIFRSGDLGGFAKAAWFLFVIVLPFAGIVTYLLVRGGKMSEHAIADAKAQEAAIQGYIRQSAGTTGTADQLGKLVSLRESGAISLAEFDAGKAKILA